MTDEIKSSFEEHGIPTAIEGEKVFTFEVFQMIIEDYLDRGYQYGREEGLSRVSMFTDDTYIH